VTIATRSVAVSSKNVDCGCGVNATQRRRVRRIRVAKTVDDTPSTWTRRFALRRLRAGEDKIIAVVLAQAARKMIVYTTDGTTQKYEHRGSSARTPKWRNFRRRRAGSQQASSSTRWFKTTVCQDGWRKTTKTTTGPAAGNRHRRIQSLIF